MLSWIVIATAFSTPGLFDQRPDAIWQGSCKQGDRTVAVEVTMMLAGQTFGSGTLNGKPMADITLTENYQTISFNAPDAFGEGRQLQHYKGRLAGEDGTMRISYGDGGATTECVLRMTYPN
jgi:hypothetical protein